MNLSRRKKNGKRKRNTIFKNGEWKKDSQGNNRSYGESKRIK